MDEIGDKVQAQIWFTADTHFGHRNIIRYSQRPFASVDEMDETLIENWNALVGPQDTVWHLGDFSMRTNPEKWLRRLHGHVHLVLGNHDHPAACRRAGFAGVFEVRYLRWQNERFYLHHYAQRVWRNSQHGAYHLYGHSHGDLDSEWGRSMDVGVDAVGYVPIAIEDVIDCLADKGPTDHHSPRKRDGDDEGRSL